MVLRFTTIVIALAVLVSCKNVNNNDVDYVYSLHTKYLPDFKLPDWKNYQILNIDESIYICYLDNGAMIFYNTKTFAYDTVSLPKSDIINGKYVMDVTDKENFAVKSGAKILYRHEGIYDTESIIIEDKIIPKNNDVFCYIPELNKVFFQVVDYKSMIPNMPYKDIKYIYSQVLGIGDSATPLNVTYDAVYDKGELGEPEVYLKTNERYIFISTNFSNKVCIVSSKDNGIKYQRVAYPGFNLKEVPRSVASDQKVKKMNAWSKRIHYSQSYGMSWNLNWPGDSADIFARMYFPEIPKITADSMTLTYADKRIRLFSGSKKLDIELPVDRYYLSHKWYNYKDKLYYLKWQQHSDSGVYYILDIINLKRY